MTYFQISNDSLPAGIFPSTIVVIPVIWSNRYLYGFVPLVAISAIAYVFVPLCIYFVYRMLHEMRNQLSERTLEMQRTLINTLVLQVTIICILFEAVEASLIGLYYYRYSSFGRALLPSE